MDPSILRRLTLSQGNHEANCDNGANLSVCVPGQLNFTGYRLHWKYVHNIHDPAFPFQYLGQLYMENLLTYS